MLRSMSKAVVLRLRRMTSAVSKLIDSSCPQVDSAVAALNFCSTVCLSSRQVTQDSTVLRD